MQNTLLTICAVGLIAAGLVGGCNRPAQEPAQTGQAGSDARAAKEFLAEHKLLGKPALIEFGKVGCELSDQGYSTMNMLHSSKIIEGLQYVRVECSDDAPAVEKYYQDNPAGFPVVQDPGGKVSDAFGATVYPIFILIDKFGNTRYAGAFPHDDLGDWSEMLIAEKSDPGPDKPRLGVKELNGPELLASTKLPELGGSDRALGQYSGPGGLVLVFVDTSCPYSGVAVKELPGVAATLKKAAMISTVVVNITDSEDTVREHYGKLNFRGIPVVFDEGSDVRMAWDVQSVPTVVFFDPQKQIAYNGPAVWADIGKVSEAALGLRPGSLRFGARGTRYG